MADTDKKDFSYIINNLYFLALVGLIIKLFLTTDTTSDGSSGPASASIWGYSLMACSVLGMLIVTYALNSNANMVNWKEGNVKFVKNIFTNSILPVLMLGILAWLITLNATYFKEINEGKIASEYSLYNNLSTFLIIIQLGLLFRYLSLTNENTNSKQISFYRVLSYLVTLGNLMSIIVLTIILKYFSTDGFTG